MAKVIKLTGLKKASLRGCKRVEKSPMRIMSGEELFVCADETAGGNVGAEVITLSGLAEAFPDPAAHLPPPSGIPSPTPAARPRGRRGRPRGTFGRRRGGYVDPRTGLRKQARNPRATVTCRPYDKDGVYWDYNDNPRSKFYGQYRCRCRTVGPDGMNTGYVPNTYCERLGLPKNPVESQRVRDLLEAQREGGQDRRKPRRRK